MAKQIRWGRVGSALSALVIAPVVLGLGLAPTALWQAVPDGEGPLTAYLADKEAVKALEARLYDGAADEALDGALDVWERGAEMQQDGALIDVAVGAATGRNAIDVVKGALISPHLSTQARAAAIPRLQAMAGVAVSRAALEARERELAWTAVGVAVRRGLWNEVPSALSWLVAPDQAMYESTYSQILLDARRVRAEASGLALMAGLQLYLRDVGHCPADLDRVGAFQEPIPYVYDAVHCELVVNTHPDEAPRIYRAQ